jgi:hypothetical protein
MMQLTVEVLFNRLFNEFCNRLIQMGSASTVEQIDDAEQIALRLLPDSPVSYTWTEAKPIYNKTGGLDIHVPYSGSWQLVQCWGCWNGGMKKVSIDNNMLMITVSRVDSTENLQAVLDGVKDVLFKDAADNNRRMGTELPRVRANILSHAAGLRRAAQARCDQISNIKLS